MKRAKRATIYVAAGLFVAAAAAKLLFPARTSETIRTVEESFHRADYRTEETVAGVTEAADDTAMPVTVTINAAEFLGLFQSPHIEHRPRNREKHDPQHNLSDGHCGALSFPA